MFSMFQDKGPLWIYEEEDLVFNASPGVVRFSEKRHFFSFLIPMVVFLIGAMMFSLFFQNYVVYNYEKMMDEDGDEPCWPEWEDRIILTNGTYLCNSEWNTYREGYSNYMTSDNHYKFKEYEETYEHRWSEQDGYLFISFIPSDTDHYECNIYIRESSLPENLTGDEFWYYYNDQPDFPDWCDDNPRSVERDYTSNSSIPFNGERIFRVHESEGELWSIEFEQFTADDRIISEYYYIDEFEGGVLEALIPAVLGSGLMIGSIFFFRKKEFVIDISNSVFTKQFASTPHLAKSKRLAKPFEMYLVHTTKEIHSSSEHGISHTKYASGMELSITGEDGNLIDVIFFRTQDARKDFKQTLEKIEFVSGTTIGEPGDQKD
ncbi:MAG: hypothetical protein ACPGAN_07650 [Candidatus Poseidoniaceae archaeon]